MACLITAAGSKSYIFQTELHGKTIRMTIGDPRTWGIGKAQGEAARLKVMTDQGTDPRQVIADAIAANEAEAAAIAAQQARESLTVAEAWQAYVAERSASMKDGKPEWGEKHKAHHHYFVQAGGVKRKRGTRTGEPRIQHVKANLAAAALPTLSLHGLRRSFGTLSEWVEVPAGIVAQIMGHKPSAIAEKHYIQRELDLLHLWHVKIEAWILEQAGIKFVPVQAGSQLVKSRK